MASKTFLQAHPDGSQELMRRVVAQGRPALPAELRRDCRIIGSVTRAMRERLDAVIGDVLTESNILEHALLLWFEKYENNCTVN